MSNLEFLKKQAKKLFNDWKSHSTIEDNGKKVFVYDSKFFDFKSFVELFDLDFNDEQSFSLMKAQHMIAQMVGYKKWNDLIKDSEEELEPACLLISNFKNADDVLIWMYYKEIYVPISRLSVDLKIHFINEFLTKDMDYIKLVRNRYLFIFDYEPEYKQEVSKDGLYSFSLEGVQCKKTFGKTVYEAKKACAKEAFGVLENSYMCEYMIDAPIFDYAEDDLTTLNRLGFIEDLACYPYVVNDKNGNESFRCRWECRRLFRTIAYECEGESEEEASYKAAYLVVKDVMGY